MKTSYLLKYLYLCVVNVMKHLKEDLKQGQNNFLKHIKIYLK